MEALAAIVDRLDRLNNTTIALKGGKPSRVEPYPRPITAVQRARERHRHQQRWQTHQALVRRALPHLHQHD